MAALSVQPDRPSLATTQAYPKRLADRVPAMVASLSDIVLVS